MCSLPKTISLDEIEAVGIIFSLGFHDFGLMGCLLMERGTFGGEQRGQLALTRGNLRMGVTV